MRAVETPPGPWTCMRVEAAAAWRSAAVATLVFASTLTPLPSQAGEYLPRLLYPGVYGKYCGPTPEVELSAQGYVPA